MKLGGLFRSQQDKNGEVNWRLDKITDKLEQLEMAIENKGYKLPIKPGEEAPPAKKEPPKIIDTPKKGVSFKMPGPSPSREEKMKKDSFWIQDIKEQFEADGENKI